MSSVFDPQLPAVATLHLAMVGNGTVSALIDPQGRVVWCCMPRFDGDPVFHALLHSRSSVGPDGTMAVELEGAVRSEQAYDANTAIVRTRIYDEAGQGIEVVDFAPRFLQRDRTFRPAQLVRRVHPLQGHPRVRFILRPRSDWGRDEPLRTRGSNHLRFVGSSGTLRVTSDAPLTYVIEETWFSLQGSVSLVLGPDETLSDGTEETARMFEEQTRLYWLRWVQGLAIPLEWQDAVVRAAITLKLCQFEETGAIVAAMTTSIPEAPGSQRNWDYRYCWLRDAFFVVRALNSLGELGTMEHYLRWLRDVVRSAVNGHVQPLYGIGLEKNLAEHAIEHVEGYRGMGPVRVGNQAFEHFQHDVYGNIVLGAAQAFHDRRLLRAADSSDFVALERIGDHAWFVYDKPDAGMWELRTRERVHTCSALMCWAACDRLGKIARVFARPDSASHWAARAQQIRTTILARTWNEQRQAFVESFGGSGLDAGVLLMAEVGFLDARDERFGATLRALEATLADGHFMRRYEAPDDYGAPQTAFNACSFWRVDALARSGRTDEARDHFEALLKSRNHVGLLSEDIDPASGELWGNFPQTYSMAGIINCAVRLSRPWESVI